MLARSRALLASERSIAVSILIGSGLLQGIELRSSWRLLKKGDGNSDLRQDTALLVQQLIEVLRHVSEFRSECRNYNKVRAGLRQCQDDLQ